MDFLKKLPGLLAKHYEKALLALSLALVVAAGVLLDGKKREEEEALKKYETDVKGRKPSLYTPGNWAAYQAVVAAGTNTVTLDFTKPRLHNLVNPVKWQRRPDDTLLKVEVGNEVGIEALMVTKVTPLYLTITADKSGGGSGYFMSVTREASTNALWRKKIPSYVTVGKKDRLNTFELKEVKGTAEAPELAIELADTAEKGMVTKDKPFQRIEGYKADLSYPPENRTFTEKRQEDTITLGSEDYNIVAITPTEVVFLSRSNNKRTTVRCNAAP